MNPLTWKREHQIVLVVAALMGCAIGLAFGYVRGQSSGGFWDWFMLSFDPGFSKYFGGFGWAILGAIIGAAFVYSVQLMRR